MSETFQFRILFGPGELRSAVGKMASAIAKDYRDTESDPLVLVIILYGGFIFGADLARALSARGVQCVIEFLHCKSYKGTRSTGLVSFFSMPSLSLRGRRVLIVEDIVDTGLTLREVIESLRGSNEGIASLRVATLLDKYAARSVSVNVDYVGLRIPEKFVVGFGLDDGGRYRELPFVGFIGPGLSEEPSDA